MTLQPASRKEVKRMSIGCCICAGLQLVAMGLLSLGGIGRFDYKVLLSTAIGTAIAILNFTLMCLMVQKAVATQDEKLRKSKIQASYNLRLLVQAGWIVAAFLLPFTNALAGAIPLLFPSLIIYYLQIKGKLFPQQETAPVSPAKDGTEPEEDSPLGPFEV